MPSNAPSSAPRASWKWIRIWDAPVRLFHWTVVLLVAASYITARSGRIEWHFLSGYAILTLVIFRIAWGVCGSETARFSQFIRMPGRAIAHLREMLLQPRASIPHEAGHNAAGAYMVIALLALLLFQTGTGLFSNDGLMVEGPLAPLVDGAVSDTLSDWHEVGFNLLLLAVALHVLAVILYAAVARQDLVRPMVTGWRRLPQAIPAPAMAPAWRAILLLAAAGAAVWGITRLG